MTIDPWIAIVVAGGAFFTLQIIIMTVVVIVISLIAVICGLVFIEVPRLFATLLRRRGPRRSRGGGTDGSAARCWSSATEHRAVPSFKDSTERRPIMGKRKSRRQTRPGFQPSANPELARVMAELRRSSAAQRHVPAPRKGTRRQRKQQAIRDQNQEG